MWGPCKMTGTYCCRHLMEVISLQMKHNIRPVHLLNVSFFESMWYDMEFTIYPQICLFISKDGQHCWIWKPLYGSDFSLCQLYLSTAVAAPALEYGTRANAWHNEPAVHVKMGFIKKKKHDRKGTICVSLIFVIVSAWVQFPLSDCRRTHKQNPEWPLAIQSNFPCVAFLNLNLPQMSSN